MTEDSIDEVLKQPVLERKPLSEEEKKEALEEGRKVWAEAMRKAGKRSKSDFKINTPDGVRLIFLATKEKVAIHEPKNPNTDLVITLHPPVHPPSAQKDNMPSILEEYQFAPGEITKVTIDTSAQKPIKLHKLLELESPLEISKIAERARAQQIENVYHPDKTDLASLLETISYAIPRRTISSAK